VVVFVDVIRIAEVAVLLGHVELIRVAVTVAWVLAMVDFPALGQ